MNRAESPKMMVVTAWLVVLLTALPKVILQEVFNMPVSFSMQSILGLGVVLAGFTATLIWISLRGLRPFLTVLGVLIASHWLVFSRIVELPFLQARINDAAFGVRLITELALKVVIALVIIAVLFLLGKKRQEFFLVKGDTAAPVEPIRWLGVKAGERWNKFGAWLTLFLSLGTLAFLLLAGKPAPDMLVRVLPFLPVVLLAAAMNAFYEEMIYKAALLSVLESPVGPRQALYMVAAYFGIGHFYGVPYGVIGVVLAGFLGWILGRSMLETRGMFWAWFIHFWQDVWIFSFLALGSIVVGGG